MKSCPVKNVGRAKSNLDPGVDVFSHRAAAAAYERFWVRFYALFVRGCILTLYVVEIPSPSPCIEESSPYLPRPFKPTRHPPKMRLCQRIACRDPSVRLCCTLKQCVLHIMFL
jgi:hypothetical protein